MRLSPMDMIRGGDDKSISPAITHLCIFEHSFSWILVYYQFLQCSNLSDVCPRELVSRSQTLAGLRETTRELLAPIQPPAPEL